MIILNKAVQRILNSNILFYSLLFCRKSDDEVETDWNDKVSTRKDRPHHCILVRHDDKVPTQCLPTALKVYNEGFASKGSVKEKLKKVNK